MYDASKSAASALKNELTKKPEDLPPEKLKQAKGLAGILTWIRKFSYFVFALITPAAAILYVKPLIPDIIYNILVIFYIIYGLFKIRDFARGTI